MSNKKKIDEVMQQNRKALTHSMRFSAKQCVREKLRVGFRNSSQAFSASE